jgi:hypothetical protein
MADFYLAAKQRIPVGSASSPALGTTETTQTFQTSNI